MNEKVKYAQLHQAGFLPGLNKQMGNKTLGPKDYPGIKMQMGFAGLNCEYQDHRFVIPYVNFQSIVLEDGQEEDEKPAKKKNA